MENKKFKKLAKEYFDLFVARFPEYGFSLGLDKYYGKWSDQSRRKYLEDIKFFKEYLGKIKKINSEKLTKEERLNKKIAIHNLNLAIFYHEKLRFWESDPDIVGGLGEIGSILFLLTARETIPFQKKTIAINRALKDLPRLFDQAKKRISKPYKLWTEMAIESCDSFKLFLEDLKLLRIKKPSKTKLLENIRNSTRAIEDYKKFLRKEALPNSVEKYGIGKKNFERLIGLRELDLTINEMLKIGEDALKENKKELKEIAREISPALTVEQVERRIKNNHPKDFSRVMKEYEKIVAQSRKFIIQNNLMKMPKKEKVTIKETPRFLKATIPFAAFFWAAKFDKRQEGIYIITPVGQKRLLKKHNYAAIANTSVHEAYPGHHLQEVLGYKNSSFVRTLSNATEFIEGWAHYCEEYMREVGFNNKNEIRFVQTLDEIWRAARIIIDINLHCGKMSFKEAVATLVKEVGMEEENAIAEVKRYTQAPSYQLSYLIGKYLIKELKRDVEEKMGERYSNRFFHQIILEAGAIPIKYLKEEFNLKIRK